METIDAVVTIAGIWAFIATAIAFGIWINK